MTARSSDPKEPTGYGRGATIGQYRVTGIIGKGGMGAVYSAEHTLLGRPAAVKVLLADLSEREDIVLRFFNEARAAAAIRHPSIVEIYDVGWSTSGSAYIVMERLGGESLGRRAARGRLPWKTAFAVARQIAGALAAAHGKGIVHRDLKPDNIFLVPDPEVPGGERIKLLDFGIAKLADENKGLLVTRTGAVLGTPTYMAPEQCRGVRVDHRADLYALGCVIFKLCAERAPFVGEGTGDVLAAHIHSPPPLLGTLVPEISPEAEALIQHLLAKRPEDRPQSAAEVIQKIDAAMRAATWAEDHTGSKKVIVTTSAAHAAPMTTTLRGAADATTTTGSPTTVAGFVRGRKGVLWLGAAIVSTAVIASIAVATCDGPAVMSDSPATAPGKQAHAAAPAANVPAVTTPGQAAPPVPAPIEDAKAKVASGEPARAPATTTGATTAVASGEPVRAPATTTDATPAVASGEPTHGTASRNTAAQPVRSPPSPAPSNVKPPPPPGAALAAQTPKTIDVVIDSVPAGAEVMLGDTVLGKTPFRGTIPRGDANVTLAVRLSGYARQLVVVRPDRSITRKLVLVGVARPAHPSDRDGSVNPFAD